MNDVFLWQNGSRVEEIRVPLPSDRTSAGFWLGDGLFETILVSNGEAFALDRHLHRLRQSQARVLMQREFDDAKLDANLDTSLRGGIADAIHWLAGETGQIRVTLLSSDDLLITSKRHVIPDASLSVTVYPYQRDEKNALVGIKTLSYGEHGFALRYAKARGFDDVIFFNSQQMAVESALANLLLWDGHRWWTPSLESGCLPGVTRELLIEYFDVKEGEFTLTDLLDMRALALASSLRDVQRIGQFDGLTFPEEIEVDRLRKQFQEWRAKNPHP